MNYYPREYDSTLRAIQIIEEENSNIKNQVSDLPALDDTDYSQEIKNHSKELSRSTDNISESVSELYSNLLETVSSDLELAQEMYNFSIQVNKDEDVYSEIENFPFKSWYDCISFSHIWIPRASWLIEISNTLDYNDDHFELFKANLKDFLSVYETKLSLHKYSKDTWLEIKEYLSKKNKSFLINKILYNEDAEKSQKIWGFWSQVNLHSLIDKNKDYNKELLVFKDIISKSDNSKEVIDNFLNNIFNSHFIPKSFFLYNNNNPESYISGIKWENLNKFMINILENDIPIENQFIDKLSNFIEKKNINLEKNDGEINYKSFISIIRNYQLAKSLSMKKSTSVKAKI